MSSECEESTKSSWRQRYVPVCTKYTSVFGMCSVRTLVFSQYVFGNTLRTFWQVVLRPSLAELDCLHYSHTVIARHVT